MDLGNPPDQYWHCLVQMPDQKRPAVVNDLTFEELERTIVAPWRSGRPFTVAGTIIRSADAMQEIRISHTREPQSAYAARHDAQMAARNIADMSTNRKLLPFSQGEDLTFSFLFDGVAEPEVPADEELVERVCRRLPDVGRILGTRSRKDKASFRDRR